MSVLALAQQLIQCPSVTPHDAGCQAILMECLSALGFTITRLPSENVLNFWVTHGDVTKYPPLVFAGHTDVVPPGDPEEWDFPPFEGAVSNGYLYGRGAVDMKGALAAMVIAVDRFLAQNPNYPGSIGFLITGDEEGPAIHGTRAVLEQLKADGIKIGTCLIGEPTSHTTAGDTLKIGSRGSLVGRFRIQGKQGHVAYPQRADNPIHKAIPFLQNALQIRWDPKPSKYFPPTAFQIVHIESGLNTTNVIPGECHGIFSFRFSTEVTANQLMERVEALADHPKSSIHIEWTLYGEPFLTETGPLLKHCETAAEAVLGIKPALSTDGGTSDGRFIAPEGIDVVELGLCTASMHAVNECVPVDHLEQLTQIYHEILKRYFVDG